VHGFFRDVLRGSAVKSGTSFYHPTPRTGLTIFFLIFNYGYYLLALGLARPCLRLHLHSNYITSVGFDALLWLYVDLVQTQDTALHKRHQA